MRKLILLATLALVVFVAALRMHSQTEQEPKPNQLGRFQVLFNPTAIQGDQTYLLDTENGNMWWLKSEGGKKTAVLVEKTK
jgi:hypothetical protein